ncbi:MAG: LruC domain-containing protein [Myxococcota bacterium]
MTPKHGLLPLLLVGCGQPMATDAPSEQHLVQRPWQWFFSSPTPALPFDGIKTEHGAFTSTINLGHGDLSGRIPIGHALPGQLNRRAAGDFGYESLGLTFTDNATWSPPVIGEHAVQLTSVVGDGAYAWVTTNFRGLPTRGSLQALDLSSLTEPTIASEILFNTTEYSDLIIEGDYAYVVGVTCYEATAAILDVYDISDPLDPTHQKRLSLDGHVGLDASIDPDGQLIVITGDDGGVFRYDLTTPDAPTLVDHAAVDDARWAFSTEDTLGVLTNTGVVLLDAKTLEEEDTVSVVGLPAEAPSRAAHHGDELFLFTLEGIQRLDLTDLTLTIATSDYLGHPNGLAFDDDGVLYLAAGEAGVRVHEVGEEISSLGILDYEDAGSANNLVLTDEALLVADGIAGLRIVEVAWDYLLDFSDGADAFTVLSGTWDVDDDDVGPYYTGTSAGTDLSAWGNAAWSDYRLRMRFDVHEAETSAASESIRLYLRSIHAEGGFSGYYIEINPVLQTASFGIHLDGIDDEVLATADELTAAWDGSEHVLDITLEGEVIIVRLDEEALFSLTDDTFSTGRAAIETSGGIDARVRRVAAGFSEGALAVGLEDVPPPLEAPNADGDFDFNTLKEAIVDLQFVDATTETPIGGFVTIEDPDTEQTLFRGVVNERTGFLSSQLTLPKALSAMELTLEMNGYDAVVETLTVRTDDDTLCICDIIEVSRIDSDDTWADSDEDNAPDARDDYPEDETQAFDIRFPTAGSYTVAFEDLYPSPGDRDYNDLVVNFDITETANADDEVLSITANVEAVARGAGYNHRFGHRIRFPGAAASTTIKVYDADGGLVSSSSGEAEDIADLTIFKKTRDALRDPKHWSANAMAHRPIFKGYTATWTLTFDEPYPRSQLEAAPYDPYLYVINTGYDIHLPGKPALDGDAEFVDRNGFPWAIVLPETFAYPIERVDIHDAYPEFEQWYTSDGTLSLSWYTTFFEALVMNNGRTDGIE